MTFVNFGLLLVMHNLTWAGTYKNYLNQENLPNKFMMVLLAGAKNKVLHCFVTIRYVSKNRAAHGESTCSGY